MSDGRNRLSGAEYRKQAAKRKIKDDEVIAKTKKLSSYFTLHGSQSDAGSSSSSTVAEKSQISEETTDFAGKLKF